MNHPGASSRFDATMSRDEIERGYNNRAAVPDHPDWIARFAARSAAAVEALHPSRDLRYGPGPKETLDLFVPSAPACGTFVFIHGGYWRSFDKADHAFVAPAFVEAGYAVALVNYDLCPQVTIPAIVDECRRAVVWLAREGPAKGAPSPLVIGGHSAGGHLATMMVATDWQPFGFAHAPLIAAVSLSGVHDLEPLVDFSYNVDLRLDASSARQMSPVNLAPAAGIPVALAVGSDETSEFLRQTRLLWEAWPRNRPAGMKAPIESAGTHHFNVVLDYEDPESELSRATFALFPH